MILGRPLIGTRSSRRSRYRQDGSQRPRHQRLRLSQQSRDRSGPGKNPHPISESLQELSTRGNEQMIERARRRLSKRAKERISRPPRCNRRPLRPRRYQIRGVRPQASLPRATAIEHGSACRLEPYYTIRRRPPLASCSKNAIVKARNGARPGPLE